MKVNTTLAVERDLDMIAVDVEGQFEYFGSFDPNARGVHLADLTAYDAQGHVFKLTQKEAEVAIDKLYDEVGRN